MKCLDRTRHHLPLYSERVWTVGYTLGCAGGSKKREPEESLAQEQPNTVLRRRMIPKASRSGPQKLHFGIGDVESKKMWSRSKSPPFRDVLVQVTETTLINYKQYTSK
jgi:hypothetical protein